MKLSVICPIYNEEKHIAACLDSILRQDFPKEELEVLLVDGMSTDRTREIVQHNTEIYKWLCLANETDKRIGDTLKRLGEREKFFNERICWDHNIVQTITAAGGVYRGNEKTKISIADVISAQTFPRDYNFMDSNFNNIRYICGMSVPPIMIKRIVERIIATNVFQLGD